MLQKPENNINLAWVRDWTWIAWVWGNFLRCVHKFYANLEIEFKDVKEEKKSWVPEAIGYIKKKPSKEI